MIKYILLLMTFMIMIGHPSVYGQETIDQKYYPKFEQIEQYAINNLNHLIDEAYIEYERKKENNELTLPILFSYVDKGKKLEEEVDEAFQALLLQMKMELNEKGLPQSIAEPYEKHYLKSKRRNKFHLLKNITLEGQTIKF